VFSDHFDILISKIILKNNKKFIILIYLKRNTLKNMYKNYYQDYRNEFFFIIIKYFSN
jgi:hypothetical protein